MDSENLDRDTAIMVRWRLDDVLNGPTTWGALFDDLNDSEFSLGPQAEAIVSAGMLYEHTSGLTIELLFEE